MSLFVTFEGGEGSGKTTQVDMLAARLDDAGVVHTAVREPGSTHLGWDVRQWLKRGGLTDEAELFLFAAARAELVANVIRPILSKRDGVVIADRYTDSTYAYQGHGRGMPIELIDRVDKAATQGLRPDLTFLMDCEPETGLERVGAIQRIGAIQLNLLDRWSTPSQARRHEGAQFEQEDLTFHRNVREGYRALASEDPKRWMVIDATRPADEIGETVWKRVLPLLPGNRTEPRKPPAPESSLC